MRNKITFKNPVVDEGQESFEIGTARATYLYHMTGCGFSSLIDRDGKDWISYRSKGLKRDYYQGRGIPNMGFDVFGHPGYETGRTELLLESPSLVKFRSSTADGAWEVEWSIHPTHATMTVLKIGAPAWLLYEGTPGGMFNPQTQFMFLSNGTKKSCSEVFKGEVPDPKWVAFCDPKTKRSIVLAYDGPDTSFDTYWPLGGKGGMTVFGFGRTDEGGFGFHLKRAPFTYSFALVESTSFEEIAAFANHYLPVRERRG